MGSRIGKLDNIGLSYRPAWHGLGTVFDRLLDVNDILTQTSVGSYMVEQSRGYVPYDPKTGRPWIGTGEENEMPPASCQWMPTAAMFNFRSDLKLPDPISLLSPAGVGEGYNVVQNNELVNIADAIINKGNARFETAGTLENGKQVWILARHPGDYDVAGDKVGRYLLIWSSHDGSKAITVAATIVRVVCWNTLSTATANNANCVSIKHTANVEERLAEAVRAVQATNASFESEQARFTSMARRAVDRRFVDAYLKSIFPDPEGENRRTAIAEKTRNRVTELLYKSQADCDGPGMRINGMPTEYALYNAIAEDLQYNGIIRPRGGTSETEARFSSNIWGAQSNKRGVALDTLSRRDELIAAVKSGKSEALTSN